MEGSLRVRAGGGRHRAGHRTLHRAEDWRRVVRALARPSSPDPTLPPRSCGTPRARSHSISFQAGHHARGLRRRLRLHGSDLSDVGLHDGQHPPLLCPSRPLALLGAAMHHRRGLELRAPGLSGPRLRRHAPGGPFCIADGKEHADRPQAATPRWTT
eukprot:5855768-Pyramimonas_sp.AAC.1